METKLNYQTGELISNQETQKEELSFMLEEAKQSYQADKLALKKQISAVGREVESLKTAFPYSATKQVEKQMEYKCLNEALSFMEKIGTENKWN